MNRTDQKIVKGEDAAVKVLILGDTGTPRDMTGETVTASLSDWESGSTINGSAGSSLEADPDADFRAGVVNIKWTDTLTAAMSVSKNRLEIKITESGGDITKIIAPFAVYVVDSVT